MVIGLTSAGVLFGFGTDFTGPAEVTVDEGECTHTLTFDPHDVDGLADEQAAIDQFADGTFPCVLWLDASGTSEFNDGEPIDEWTDRSTNLLSAQPTGEAPRWTTVDGVPAAQFGADAGGLSADLDADNQTLDAESGLTVTMLVYVENRPHHGGLYAISDDGGDANSTDDSEPAVGLTGSDASTERSQADQWRAIPGPQPTVTQGQWAILTHTVDAESGELFVDGDSQGRVEGGVDELGSEVHVGERPSGETFDGSVAALFVTDERLSTGQRNLVECAIDDKHDSVVDVEAC